MLVKVKNPDLYRAWYEYFSANCPEMPAYAKRTYAFFNSERGLLLPGQYSR